MAQEENKFQRQTAQISTINELLQGSYVVQEGWKPNYIKTPSRQIVRVNLMGIVVDKPSPYQFLLDDGTGSVLVIDFNQFKKTLNLKVGEPVLVIGRPRKSDHELFIAAEIVNADQIKQNPSWMSIRKEELKKLHESFKEENSDEEKSVPASNTVDNIAPASRIKEVSLDTVSSDDFVSASSTVDAVAPASGNLTGDDVIDFVKKKDSGDGCSIEEIVSFFGEESDNVILTLMSMGEVYEIKPGRIKILE